MFVTDKELYPTFLDVLLEAAHAWENALMICLQATPGQQKQDSTGRSAVNICQSCSASLQSVANRVQDLLEDNSNPQVNPPARPVVPSEGQG